MSEIETLSLLFDSAWYLATYQDVATANCDPLEHYLSFGYREGRNPNRYFNTNFYLNTYPDLASCHLNPFIHYILYGASEGRLPRSPHESPLPQILFDIFIQEEPQAEDMVEASDVVTQEENLVLPAEPIKKETKPATTKSKKTVRKPAPQTKTGALAQKRKRATKS